MQFVSKVFAHLCIKHRAKSIWNEKSCFPSLKLETKWMSRFLTPFLRMTHKCFLSSTGRALLASWQVCITDSFKSKVQRMLAWFWQRLYPFQTATIYINAITQQSLKEQQTDKPSNLFDWSLIHSQNWK